MSIALAIMVATLAIGAGVRAELSRGAARESTGEITLPDVPTGTAVDYEAYATTLRTYVDDIGLVDYSALKANPDALNTFLTSAANLDPAAFATWTKSEQIAFWCNVYNAYTLKAIIDHYPIRGSFFRSLMHPKNSIRQIPGVWDEMTWPVMGKRMTLDNIEHDTLRFKFDEPRIHAVLVCAARSCPPLRNEPYDGERLEEQLNDQMKRFLGVPERFRIDRENDVVYLSSILAWYGTDFLSKYGPPAFTTGASRDRVTLLNAINPHISEDDAEYLRAGGFEIEYLRYDWSLNEQE